MTLSVEILSKSVRCLALSSGNGVEPNLCVVDCAHDFSVRVFAQPLAVLEHQFEKVGLGGPRAVFVRDILVAIQLHGETSGLALLCGGQLLYGALLAVDYRALM